MKDIQSLKSWNVVKDTPIAIAGPCSAESEEQLMTTYEQILENIDVSLLRAGIWKPRTRPGNFEGHGEEALKWLKAAKERFGKPVTVEVATADHVELALKYGVDVLWIGARSTVNPFTVQEIADALKGVKDVPVIIKNPLNPDLALWKGAIERIYTAGVTQIAALHRGFSSFEKTKYRNVPMWKLAIDLKTDLPNIPLICDPSHIGGSRDLILPISQKAMDLDFDGLMIETHCNPDEAWSDAKQQVTPPRLAEILNEIKIKKSTLDPSSLEENKLDTLRQKINRIDKEIIEILASRMNVVDEIGEYKKDNNLTVFQADRWIDVFQSRPQAAADLGLDKNFAEQLFKLIHDESIRLQTKAVEATAE